MLNPLFIFEIFCILLVSIININKPIIMRPVDEHQIVCPVLNQEFELTKELLTKIENSKELIKRIEGEKNKNSNELITPIKPNTNNRVDHPDYYNLEDGPYVRVEMVIPESMTNGLGVIKTKQKVPIECIDVIRDMPTWKGNVFKYLWRCGVKTEDGMSVKEKELEDMKKALWYLKDKIDEMEGA